MNDTALASRLEGKTIGKWEILEKRIKTEEDASGKFSSCYKVKNIEGEKTGFFKAFNYQYAFNELGQHQSSADFLKVLTSNFTYERDLLLLCKTHGMKKVVSAIDHGEYREVGELFPVPYLIFEIADGSLKNFKAIKDPDLAWKLGAFHGFLVGLSQLHAKKIVHQDIKPSNILIFGGEISKLSDLGSATQLNNRSPLWDQDGHCGDWHYAPIELLYGYCSPNWDTRRLGADLFMSGGIITYLITDSNFLWLLHENLPEIYRPSNFGGGFEQVKPHLMAAYYKTLNEVALRIPENIRQDLMEVISQLSHPIPEERGIPRTLRTSLSNFSLQRYISIIDRLAKKIELMKYE